MKVKAKEKREKIFKKYASNLKDCLEYHGMCLALKSDKEFERIIDDFYMCPLCKKIYFENSLDQTNNRQPILTLEHNPPKSIGGSASILTCANCNNLNGTILDKAVATYLKTEDFIKGRDGAKIAARSKFGNYSFTGELELNLKECNFLYLDKKSNEFGFSELIKRNGQKETSKVSLELKFANSNTLNKAVLKIAHLTVFKYLGYSYLFSFSGTNIVQILNGILNHPSENYGVLGFDFGDADIGLSVINEPKELRSFLIVQKVKIEGREKNVGVIIPSLSDKGFSCANNFNNYKNMDVQLELVKYEINNFPCRPDICYSTFV